MLNPKPDRKENEKHRRFIASLPCCVTGLEKSSQCAHIRSGTGGGMGYKPDDTWCVPLCFLEHDKQHRIGERLYWGEGLELAKKLAKGLHKFTGNERVARKLIRKFRAEIRNQGEPKC
jgi:hypothetical protein